MNKRIIILKAHLILLSVMLFTGFAFSQRQTAKVPSGWLEKNPFEQKVFIENKGQFDQQAEDKNSKVYYSTCLQGIKMLFTANGLTYRYDKKEILAEEEKNGFEKLFGKLSLTKNKKAAEYEKEKAIKITPQYLSVEWVGSSATAEIVAENKVDHYYTYNGKNNSTIKASAFKKLIYKNIYPNIDLVYTIPQDSSGIEYTFIVHPGGDPSLIQMKHKGATDIALDAGNKLLITSAYGLFTDHAPVAFYADNHQPIDVSFILNTGNTVGIALNTSKSERTIVIDPWTTTPNMSDGKAFDINYDAQGNVYVSGEMQKVAKFNSSGTLQWTYSLTASWYSDFAVDEVTSEIYMFDCPNGSINIYKLDPTGVVAANGTSSTNVNEVWRAEFDRCNNQIVVGSGSYVGGAQAFTVDKNNLSNVVPKNVFNESDQCHDISLLAIDDDGTACYFLATESACGNAALHNNEIVKCPLPNLVPSSLSINSGFTFSEVFFNVSHYTPPALGGTSHGFNGMKVRGCFLYGYDGNTIKIWDKQTGTLSQTVTVGGGLFDSGGLDVDACGNIYAGNGNTIKVYDAAYNLINTLNVSNTIYDLKLGLNNDIYACGDGFVQKIDLSGLTIQLQTTLVDAACNGCNGSATAELICNNAASSFCTKYLWSTGATTQTVTNLCAGTYTVSVDAGCGTSYTDSITILTGTPPSVTASNDDDICENETVALSATGGLTYKWSPGSSLNDSTSATPMASPTVTTTYVVSGYNAAGCADRDTVTITVHPKPLLTKTAVDITCNGLCNGQTIVIPTGGTAPYTYSWTGGCTNASCNNLCSGTYTVTVTDAIGCSNTADTSVSEPPALVSSLVSTTPASCNGICDGAASVTASGGTAGTNGYNYSWNSVPAQTNATATGLCAGTYTCTITDGNACTSTVTATITEPTPVVINPFSPVMCVNTNTTLTAAATGGNGNYSYSWDAPSNPAFATTATVTLNITTTTSYTVNAADMNGCAAPPVTVTLSPAIQVAFSADTLAGCQPLCVNFSDDTNPAAGTITNWDWNFGDGTEHATSANVLHCYTTPGQYTVSLAVTSSNGCTEGDTINNMITVYPNPVANFNPSPNPANVLEPVITFNNTSSNDVNYWNWNFGDGSSSLTGISSPEHQFPKDTSGAYNVTLIVQNTNGCYDTTTRPVVIDPQFTFFIPNAFSPDGDGINDTFYGTGVGIIAYDLWIFDRWGNMLFHSDDLFKGWDSKIDGGEEKAQIDVYVWKVKLTDIFNKKHNYIGTVTIVR
jgi:gliding motility-associated-like protein